MQTDNTNHQTADSPADPGAEWREYLNGDREAFAAEFATATAYLRDGNVAGLAEHLAPSSPVANART